MGRLTESPAWRALQAHAAESASQTLAGLFGADPGRAQRLGLQVGPLFVDWSRQRVSDRTLALLLALARQQGLAAWIDRLFAGDPVNDTEGRAALHMALRNRSDRPMSVDGANVMPAVRRVLARMRAFTDAVRGGQLRGHTGQPFRTVVNIGIGGSDLGPCMAVEALRAWNTGAPTVRFVSNVDDAHLVEALRGADPGSTLFVVSSKTFTTQETMANAASARAWVTNALGEAAVPAHFAAVSTNLEATAAFGITAERVFEFWDWVGGRYSLWSAIGLPVALAVGMDHFEALLAGAHAVDEHFRLTPLGENAPVLLGLLGVWNVNFLGCATQAVVPYEQYLHRLPAHLQQLEMESNGKGVDRDGEPVDYATGPVVWGEPGTNGQHAFFQLMHQGTQVVPVDFILAARGAHGTDRHHALLLANGLAQASALAGGRSPEEAMARMLAEGVAPDRARQLAMARSFPGNRPSTTILMDRLEPATLGALVALYEHKVFVQSVVWNINPFDQWGVELGKQIAGRVLPHLEGDQTGAAPDPATRAMVARIRALGGP